MNRRKINELFLAVFVFVTVMGGLHYVGDVRKREPARAQLLTLMMLVNESTDREQVRAVMDLRGLHHLRLIGREENLDEVHTPVQFGNQGWALHISYSRAGKVSSMRVRTRESDRPDIRPAGAPEDVEFGKSIGMIDKPGLSFAGQ